MLHDAERAERDPARQLPLSFERDGNPHVERTLELPAGAVVGPGCEARERGVDLGPALDAGLGERAEELEEVGRLADRDPGPGPESRTAAPRKPRR